MSTDWRSRRRRRAPRERLPGEVVPPERSDVRVDLSHLHRYFEGCVVKGELSPIRGNDEARMGATLNWLVCGNGTILRGESGSAKTKTMEAIVHLAYGDEGLEAQHHNLLVLGHGSNLELFTEYGVDATSKAARCYIPEFQNIANMMWIVKLWLEGRSAEHGRAEAGGQKHAKYRVAPLPVLTSLADGNEFMPDVENEMKRRMLSFYTRSDEALNEGVHAMKAAHRWLPEEDMQHLREEEFYALRYRLESAMADTRRVVNPCAPSTVAKVVPTKYAISNTFIDYWFDLVEGVARFYRAERPSTPRYIFATPGDVYVAHMLVGDTVRDLALGIPPLGREIMEFVPEAPVWDGLMADMRGDGSDLGGGRTVSRMSLDAIVDYLDEQGFPRSKVVIQSAMDRMVAAGLVKQDDRKLYYRTKSIGGAVLAVDWATVVEESVARVREKYPVVLEEYEAQARHYIHPFTGVETEIPASPVGEERRKSERRGGMSNVDD